MRNKYTIENLTAAVEQSRTWRDVCRYFNVSPISGAQTYLKNLAIKWQIDYSHFVGKKSNLGRTFKKQDLTQHLIVGSTIKSNELKKRLIRDGYKDELCEECGLTEWNGYKPPLELHHINSNHMDNRLENVSIVCANCHHVLHNGVLTMA